MSEKCPYQFDLMDPRKMSEGVPFEELKTLREKCPVAQQDATEHTGEFWAITKREDVDFVSKNPAIFSSSANLAHPQPGGEDPESTAIMRQLIIDMDPPGHVQYRKVVKAAFTVRAVDALEPMMREYAKQIVDKIAPKGSVLDALLNGVVEGEALTEMEFCTFFLILIAGGVETTRTATNHGMRLLTEHPEELQKLVDDPALIPGAVEEILRFHPSFAYMQRTAMEDVRIGSMEIKNGDILRMYYPSVNHDADVFGGDAE